MCILAFAVAAVALMQGAVGSANSQPSGELHRHTELSMTSAECAADHAHTYPHTNTLSHNNLLQADFKILKETVSVTIGDWQGGAGNNLYKLATAWVYAEHVGACELHLPEGGAVQDLFSLPETFVVARPHGRDAKRSAHISCPKDLTVEHTWFDRGCLNATTWNYREVLLEYILPFLKSDLAQCLQDRQAVPEVQDHELTIHMRSGSIFTATAESARESNHEPHYGPLFGQPPCAMYDRIIAAGPREGRPFERIAVITEDRSNPCVDYLVANYGERVEVHEGRSLAEDVCSLLGATNLVVSRSSFSYCMAFLGRARRINGSFYAFFLDWEPWGWLKSFQAGVSGRRNGCVAA
ncbi:unnamed protein product [Polarella glacialis]|uniref:Fucosyltransferase n=1 Tax=Polarella glacialis TaxID=89957 RepID=A0A813JF16_POLGL|nr:unnamed protein product [Polarella glacialis]